MVHFVDVYRPARLSNVTKHEVTVIDTILYTIVAIAIL